METGKGSEQRPITRAVRSLAISFVALSLAFLLLSPPLTAALADGATGPEIHYSFARFYRASVYISIFSIQIFTRSGVGSGFAGVDQKPTGDGSTFSVQFMAGSDPHRAHGLNRLGIIQEVVHTSNQSMTSADYFGLMTHSGEESLQEAKASIGKSTGDTILYVASRAHLSGNKGHYTKDYFREPSSYGLSDAGQLIRTIEAGLNTSHSATAAVPLSQQTETFLYSLLEIIRSNCSRAEKQFFYNGTTFRLVAEKKLDRRAGEEFRRVGLTTRPAEIEQLVGTIQNQQTESQTSFRLWFDASSQNVLPLRFEFRPRSFLKLVFDAEPTGVDPATTSISFATAEDIQP